MATGDDGFFFFFFCLFVCLFVLFFLQFSCTALKKLSVWSENKMSLANKHATKNRVNPLVSETGSDGPQPGATSLHQSPPVSKS